MAKFLTVMAIVIQRTGLVMVSAMMALMSLLTSCVMSLDGIVTTVVADRVVSWIATEIVISTFLLAMVFVTTMMQSTLLAQNSTGMMEIVNPHVLKDSSWTAMEIAGTI